MANVPATISPASFALFQSPIEEIMGSMQANLAGETLTQFDLRAIKMPSSGGKFWSIPTLEGEVPAPHFDGIIVLARNNRAYYSVPFEQRAPDASPAPDCSSLDGVNGYGYRDDSDRAASDYVHDCGTCPLAQFGTGRNGGPACQARRVLFVLREGDTLPIVLSVPSTGMKAVKDYFLGLASANVPHWGVVTRFGLEQRKNKQGIEYSVVTLAVAPGGSSLTPEQKTAARQYKEMIDRALPTKPLIMAAADATVETTYTDEEL